MAEVLRALIAACSELLRASPLSDAALFQNYAMLALIFDTVVKEVGMAVAFLFVLLMGPPHCTLLDATPPPNKSARPHLQGHVELLDRASIQRAIAFKLPITAAEGGDKQKGAGGLLKSLAG